MKLSPRGSKNARSRSSALLAVALLLVASAWLLSRVVVGLDFSNEMQYYGQITSLVRTGKLFQDDLFLQQLGYVFVLPVFELHAWLFPDGSFLIVFGRLTLVALYLASGGWLWRATGITGVFSLAQRLTALAAFLAWIPFQLLALNYNTLAYLLVVALLACRLTREVQSPTRYVIIVAGLLTLLAFVYPTVGFILIAAAALDQWQHAGIGRAAALLGATLAVGVTVAAGIGAWHGADFFQDLALSLRFSRGFASGAIFKGEHLAGWVLLTAACGLTLWRLQRGAPWARPAWTRYSVGGRRILSLALLISAAWLLTLAASWTMGYLPAALYLLLLVACGCTLGAHGSRLTAAGFGLACVAILVISLRWATGYFATTVYMVVLAVLAASGSTESRRPLLVLIAAGTSIGCTTAFTSGNGLHNFGVGTAGVLPLLLLYLARDLELSGGNAAASLLARTLPAGLVTLLLVNGVLYPYREQPVWNRFERLRGVPAFAGIWTSPVKREAVATLRQLISPAKLAGQRLLVAGPHPWLYFMSGTRPATPMFFMHFSINEANYDVVSANLFRTGRPDALVITTGVPRAIHAKIAEWVAEGRVVQKLTLAEDFRTRYAQLTRQELGSEILLLTGAPKPP